MNRKIYGEIFTTFITNADPFQNSFHAFTAVEVCNIIASALIVLDENVELSEIAKYDLQGKILALRKRLEKTDNPDKDNIIRLIDIIRTVPIGYFSEVADFIKNKVNNKGINLEKNR